jgi:hypothetical protein
VADQGRRARTREDERSGSSDETEEGGDLIAVEHRGGRHGAWAMGGDTASVRAVGDRRGDGDGL